MENKKYGMAELLAEFGDGFDKMEEESTEVEEIQVVESEKKEDTLHDITIKCKKCENDFVWTIKDQEFYKEKGFFKPAYCKDCRKKTKVINNFHKDI